MPGMDDIGFLPSFPLAGANMILVGAILLCGLAVGQIFVRVFKLPRITGFVAAGLALGPGALGLHDQTMLGELSVFVDISLGLILFELGRRLGVRWFTHDRWRRESSGAECLRACRFVQATTRLCESWPGESAARARGEMSPELDERFALEIMLCRFRMVNSFSFPVFHFVVPLGLFPFFRRPHGRPSVLQP